MNQFPRLIHRLLPYTLVALALASYTVVFADYHHQLGLGIASLATIPVVVAAWYFGIQGGILVAFLTIAVSSYFQSSTNQSLQVLFTDPGNILRMISLLLVAVVTGRLSVFTRERREAVSRLAHSNDLIYSILQITPHMEKALAIGVLMSAPTTSDTYAWAQIYGSCAIAICASGVTSAGVLNVPATSDVGYFGEGTSSASNRVVGALSRSACSTATTPGGWGSAPIGLATGSCSIRT